jgi:hypothetical protein
VTTRPIETLHFVFSAGAVATSIALATPQFAVSVAAGAAIEALNFRGLAIASQALCGGVIARRGAWLGLLGLRLLVLATVLLLALQVGASPAGLLVGLSVILPASLIGAFALRPPVDPSVGPTPPVPPADDPSWDTWNPWLARERTRAEDEERR